MAAAILCSAGFGYGRYRVYLMNQDVLPEFVEPKTGPRTAVTNFLGVEIGHTSLENLQSDVLVPGGWDCSDRSARAMLQEARRNKQAEIERVKAAGGDVDTVSGASLANRRSPRERNPQVRMSCENTNAQSLPGSGRVESVGRLLYVFDSPNHPVRHASFERVHSEKTTALADFRATIDAVTATYGPPIATTAPVPKDPDALPWLEPLRVSWRWSDLEVSVTLLNFGGPRGIRVGEVAEVPWPVRANAPREADG